MIVYKNGRLMLQGDGEQADAADQAMKASALRQQAKDEAAARLSGLKAQQKAQASALKDIKAGKSPSVIDTVTGKIMTPAGSTGSTAGTGGGKGGVAQSATDKALADAQDRRRKLAAALAGAGALETQSTSAADKAMAALKALYEPQTAAVDAQRAEQLRLLQNAIEQGQTDITSAEADFMKYLPSSTAYQNVPLLSLEQAQNPLLAALQQQGAGTAQVESQRALDAALAKQLSDLSSRAATQTGASEQAYLDAVKRAGAGAALAGRTYLGQRQPEIQAGIQSKYDEALANLAADRAKAEADVQNQLQTALAQAIADKAKAEADYGPIVPTKKKKAQAATAGLASTVEGR